MNCLYKLRNQKKNNIINFRIIFELTEIRHEPTISLNELIIFAPEGFLKNACSVVSLAFQSTLMLSQNDNRHLIRPRVFNCWCFCD